ncbi:MAG: hypothetical protein Q7S40_12695 [Opitutaceae bacterium]|nr:hypothetical protein [Opitutaceae bacterium]
MTAHRLKVLTSSLAALCAVAIAHGQAAPRPPASSSEPGSAPTAPKRTRAISPELAAQLSAGTPKYTPAPPKPEPKPEEELPDMRDIDKPKNAIIRLPKYIVQEPKPAVLNERAVHTPQGLADLAVRRYISDADRALNRYTIPLFAPITLGGGSTMEQRALTMYAEDERLRNMAELGDNARMISTTDQAAGTYVKREVDKTYVRTSDFGWNNGKR